MKTKTLSLLTLSALLLSTSALQAEFDNRVENTNFTLSQGSLDPNNSDGNFYNYDRFRFRSDYTNGDFFATFIGDGVNYLGRDYIQSPTFKFVQLPEADVPFQTQTEFQDYGEGSIYAKLYRFYGGYEDVDNRLVVGLQNITMGVGRFWNPTNLFNPRNTYAIEPDEVFGVAAVNYTRHINETSDVMMVASQKADHSFKYALSYKAFLEYGDFAINLVTSNETLMAGYEFEANLGDTGIEVRSEGAYIENTLKTLTAQEDRREFFQGILGADYGFINGITLTVEGFYSSETFSQGEIFINYDSEIASNLVFSNLYLGASVSYVFNLVLSGGIAYIESFNTQNSRFISPSLNYALNDYNTFDLGAMLYFGENSSEFGLAQDSLFLKYTLAF